MTARRALLLILSLALGASVNLYRVAVRLNVTPPIAGEGFRPPFPAPALGPIAWTDSHAVLRIPGNPWRPLRVSMDICPPQMIADAGLTVTIAANQDPPQVLMLRDACTPFSLVTFTSEFGDLVLRITSRAQKKRQDQTDGVGLAHLRTTPVFTAWAVFHVAAKGAVSGGMLWLLFGLRPARQPNATTISPLKKMRERLWLRPHVSADDIVAFFLVATYFSAWAVLKAAVTSPRRATALAARQFGPSPTLGGET